MVWAGGALGLFVYRLRGSRGKVADTREPRNVSLSKVEGVPRVNSTGGSSRSEQERHLIL